MTLALCWPQHENLFLIGFETNKIRGGFLYTYMSGMHESGGFLCHGVQPLVLPLARKLPPHRCRPAALAAYVVVEMMVEVVT